MPILKGLNLALAFGLELGLLVAVGYWGVTVGPTTLLKVALGLGGPLVIGIVWGVFMAPTAARRLRQPWRLAAAVGLFGLGSVAWYAAGQPALAVIFALLFALNRVLLSVWRQD